MCVYVCLGKCFLITKTSLPVLIYHNAAAPSAFLKYICNMVIIYNTLIIIHPTVCTESIERQGDIGEKLSNVHFVHLYKKRVRGPYM